MKANEEKTLNEARGPSSEVKGDAKRYVSDSSFRARVDAADKRNGTTVGKQLRDIYYGVSPQPQAETHTRVSEHELAEAIRKYPREKCVELFTKPADAPGQSSSSLSKTEYKEAKLAAIVHGVIPADSGQSVSFNYQTRRDRDVKRAAKEAEAKKQESGPNENGLPPGVERNAKDGIGLIIVDPVAFNAWKQSKSDRAVIAAAIEQNEAA